MSSGTEIRMPVATLMAPAEPCVFCGSIDDEVLFEAQYHARRLNFGPFDIVRCRDCGSWGTRPVPSAEELRELYGGYVDGLPEDLVSARGTSSQTAWYRQCARHAAALASISAKRSQFDWLEVAPGNGDFSEIFTAMFPRSEGTAVDLHDRPSKLQTIANLDWRCADLNGNFPEDLHGRFDLVISISVFEHVQYPDRFLAELLACTKPGGTVYIVCPNAGSMIAHLLRARWPYALPGEHLFMPTLRGSRMLVQKTLNRLKMTARTVTIRPVLVPYTIRYLGTYARLDRFTAWVPAGWSVPTPAGAQEIVIRRAA